MIKIVGDICFSDGYFDVGFGIGSKLKEKYNPFEHLKFDSDDIWIGNLECVISDISKVTGFKKNHFRVPYHNVSALNHFNVYGVANNHVMQHGPEAYNQMLENINRLGSKYVGSVTNKTLKFDHKGYKFAIAVFSQRAESFSEKPLYWSCPDYIELASELSKLLDCKFKIAYMHWGNEFINYPSVEQKKLAHWLIDIGYDLVIGTHSHVLQGFEVYNNKYIFYSLGNFLFNMPTEETRFSAMVNLDIDQGELKVSYDYILIDKECKPAIVTQEKADKKFKFDTLNKKNSFNGDNEVYFRDVFKQLSIYRHKNHRWMLSTLSRHNFKEFLYILRDFIDRRV